MVSSGFVAVCLPVLSLVLYVPAGVFFFFFTFLTCDVDPSDGKEGCLNAPVIEPPMLVVEP